VTIVNLTGRPEAEDVELDLRPAAIDPWADLEVPRGWGPVAGLARHVHGGLDELTDRIVACIDVEIPAYRAGPVPREDLARSIRHNVDMILLGLAERREPTPDEIRIRRELGTRRAVQGMPVDALLAAYHVGYRELWASLVRAVPPDDGHLATQLLTAATLVWSWVHQLTDAIAASHAGTVRTIEARAVGARQRFVELLVGGDLGGDEADRLARSLGFDPDGTFVVAVLRGVGDDDLEPGELQRRLDGIGGRHAVATRGPLVVAACQLEHPAQVPEVCRALASPTTVAVGARRDGLGGARDSLRDAELTLSVLEPGTIGTFEDTWLWATLAGAEPRLRPLLAHGAEVARDHPHLAEAVTAFAEAGFSVSEAARRLSLHANTVAYRLDRWGELTGWSPRRFPGLVRSLAALRLQRSQPGPAR
jgi:hypothetical protein